MALLVLAYPQLHPEDFDQIQACRALHDGLYFTSVEPHFTLVFPVENISPEMFIAEIGKQAAGVPPITCTLRCATVNKDAFSDYYHTFLVPDEGYSQMVKLHDKLYSGQLQDALRLDIDFIPHIGIGNATDKRICKKIADEWNATAFAIKASIVRLTIVAYEKGRLHQLHEIIL